MTNPIIEELKSWSPFTFFYLVLSLYTMGVGILLSEGIIPLNDDFSLVNAGGCILIALGLSLLMGFVIYWKYDQIEKRIDDLEKDRTDPDRDKWK